MARQATQRRKGGDENGGAKGDYDGERSAAEKAPHSSVFRRLSILLVAALLAFGVWFKFIRRPYPKVDYSKNLIKPKVLETHCQEHIGPPRVLKVCDDVWVAIGYDLANTILIKTSEGHVVVDVAMNPKRATTMRQALEEAAGKANIHTVIYTHSHVDHVGGAESWTEEGTEVWATEALLPHFFKQYGAFRKAETLRGSRQFGEDVALSELPCSGIGGRPDVKTTVKNLAFVPPTNTFNGHTSFKVGELTFELYEAHGETHDQLLVWIPEKKVLLPGDNYYEAFPNLYTIRGSSPRPIKSWVASLDLMRRLAPEYLVPSHTRPVVGKDNVAKQLRDYRDGIQFVLTQTVRGANDGKSMDELAEGIALPPHLRNQTALDELYGQIDWSVRAIFTNELGWFDGRPEDLYRLPHKTEASKTLEAMGGLDKVLAMVEEAQSKDEDRWALHLIKVIEEAGVVGDAVTELEFQEMLIRSLRGVSGHVYNTNGRAYLLQVAKEISGEAVMEDPIVREVFVRKMPISLLFDLMTTRVVPELAADMHRTALFTISGKKYYVTIRYGVLEVVEDEPLYGTPDPVVEFTLDAMVFRQIALKVTSPVLAVARGDAVITGDLFAFKEMMDCIESGA